MKKVLLLIVLFAATLSVIAQSGPPWWETYTWTRPYPLYITDDTIHHPTPLTLRCPKGTAVYAIIIPEVVGHFEACGKSRLDAVINLHPRTWTALEWQARIHVSETGIPPDYHGEGWVNPSGKEKP